METLCDFGARMAEQKACKHPVWVRHAIPDPLDYMSKFDLPQLLAGDCAQDDKPYICERCTTCGEKRMIEDRPPRGSRR